MKIDWAEVRRDIPVYIFTACFYGTAGSWLLYGIFKAKLFKIVGVITAMPLILALAALFFMFFGSFIIYCIRCLMPWIKDSRFFIFDDYDEMPWWGAAIWLVVILTFVYSTVPLAIHNLAVSFGFIEGEMVEIGAQIASDQSTIWGMFKAWAAGERNVINSIVSWGLIAVVIGLFAGIGWLVRALMRKSGDKMASELMEKVQPDQEE